MEYLLAATAVLIMVLLLGVGWLMTLLGLPGTWLIVISAAAYAYLVPDAWRVDLGWPTVIIALALAVLGEIVEAAAAAAGAGRAGGSKRAAALALCGSIAGGLAGALVGLPIPLIGPVVAVVLGAAGGATVGAMLGERWRGRSTEESWAVGKGAFWGRLLGTLGKVVLASIIVASILIALVWK